MSKDIKVEILYFKTPADVSLEFGLHGNYPLRLLSSSCGDKQAFFKKLKRAVSRSEIIITVGGYGESRLPEFTARAIGKQCYVPDYRHQGIIFEEKYAIPETAVPLSSTSKKFGGFLMECGPQTLISLTDDRKIRLDVVEHFVVDYITEHHTAFNTFVPLTASKSKDGTEPTEPKSPSDDLCADMSPKEPLPQVGEGETEHIAEQMPSNNTDGDLEARSNHEPTDEEPDTKIASNESEIDFSAIGRECEAEAPSVTSEGFKALQQFDLDFDELSDEEYEHHTGCRHIRRRVRLFCLLSSVAIVVITLACCLLFPKKERDRTTATVPPNGLQSGTFTSSDITSSDFTVDTPALDGVYDREEEDEPTDNEYYEDMPDVILPPLPDMMVSSVPSQSDISSHTPSSPSTSSSNTSSSTVSSSASSVTSSNTVTSATSSAAQSSTVSSSSASSTAPSSSSAESSSSQVSSSATSSTAPNPNIDPIYTWDITLYVTDSATGISYINSAVNIVAMIIEDEMSPTIDPKEALIAQSIAAYNWLINNGARNPSTAPKVALDPNPYPQAFECAQAAKGSVLVYGNTLARTNYYAYSAGKTANIQDIWGGTAYPYLQSVDCSVDEELSNFQTIKTYTADELRELILQKCGIDVSNTEKSKWIEPTKYDSNGLYLVTLKIGGKEYKGQFLRSTLLSYQIRSTAVTVEYDPDTDKFIFTCKGYGHGVGMSQRGAKSYAKLGWTHEQILSHFFPGTILVKN